MALTEEQRTEVLAQLHHKLLEEPHQQPSVADVEEVAWWEACELDRVRAELAHAKAAMVRERERADQLMAELDAAWAGANTPVRGMVTLAEVIEGRRDAYEELKTREATLLDAINAVRDAVNK